MAEAHHVRLYDLVTQHGIALQQLLQVVDEQLDGVGRALGRGHDAKR